MPGLWPEFIPDLLHSKNSYHIEIKSLANSELEKELKQKIENNPGPLSGLGFLSDIAVKLGLIQKSLHPVIKKTALLIFAADHGIAESHIIPGPKEATHQKVRQFLDGNHPVITHSKKHKINVRLVDVGVNHSFEKQFNYWLHKGKKLIDRKITNGTNNFLIRAALSTEDALNAIETGRTIAGNEIRNGAQCISISQISHGADLSITALYSTLFQLKVEDLTNREESLVNLIQKALNRDPMTHDIITILSLYGGLEIAATCGAMLESASQGIPFITEGHGGLISLVIAAQINKEVLAYAFLASVGHDTISQKMLNQLQIEPLLNLGSQEAEGMGILLSYPIIKQAEMLLKN